MKIDIRNVPAGHSVVVETTDLGHLKEVLPPFREKISCRAEIDRSGPILYIHMLFHGAFTLECSRCLNRFNYPVEGDMRLVVKEQPGKHGPTLDDESTDFYFDSRHVEIDLGPAIYDEIMTAFPLKPLCSQECKGIEVSKESGQSVQYGVQKDEIDPRWEALKKLKGKSEKKEEHYGGSKETAFQNSSR